MNIGKETEQIEFKTSLAEQKQGFESIVSILNKHQSGSLYFGVLDNGDIKGLQIGKDTLNPKGIFSFCLGLSTLSILFILFSIEKALFANISLPAPKLPQNFSCLICSSILPLIYSLR